MIMVMIPSLLGSTALAFNPSSPSGGNSAFAMTNPLAATKDMLRLSRGTPWHETTDDMASLVQEDDSMSPCFQEMNATEVAHNPSFLISLISTVVIGLFTCSL